MSDFIVTSGSSGRLRADYPITIFFPGVLNSNQEMVRINVVRSFVLPQNCVGSIATLAVEATASTVFKIKKNGAQIGTMTFAAGGSNATFSLSSDTTFNTGDIISVQAPASADATAAGIAITLSAMRLS